MKKELNIVMLASDKESHLYINHHGNLFMSSKPYPAELGDNMNQHLYVTVNGDMQDGDWFIHTTLDGVSRLFKFHALNTRNGIVITDEGGACNIKYCQKVIATTDETIIPMGDDGIIAITFGQDIYKLQDEYLWDYSKEYNSGNQVFRVEVNYQCSQCEEWGWVDSCRSNCNQKFIQPIIKDGNIVISNLKNSVSESKEYSLAEVKKLIELHSDFIDDTIDYDGINSACCSISTPEWDDEKFIKDNL